MERNEEQFILKDFYLSVCLLASGLPLKKIERSSGKFSTFIFADPEKEAEETIRKHWEGELLIPTRKLVEAIGELKTRLSSGL